MSLRLVSGRNGSGKTTRIIEEMKRCEGAIYIVPDQLGFAAEKRVVAACALCGLGSPTVLSFRRLCHFLTEREGGEGERFGVLEREMVVRRVVSLEAEKLSLFGGAAKRGALSETAVALIDTFKKCAITPQMLEDAAERVTSPLLRLKLRDSHIIYSAYEAFCAEHSHSTLEDMQLLAQKIEETSFFDSREVFINKFSAFSPDEYRVILALLKKAKHVTVALTIGAGDEFSAPQKTYIRLLAIAAENGIRTEKPIILRGAMQSAAAELRFLEENLFAAPKATYLSPTQSVYLACEKTPYAETEALAREITALVRDEGYRYGEIAVVARDLSLYERYLKRVFPRFGIPLFLDRKTTLAETGIALFVRSVLNLMTSRWSYESVFSYVKTSFSGISETEADILENYCLAAKVLPSDWKKDERWDMRMGLLTQGETSTHEARSADIADKAREKLVRPVSALEEKLRTKSTVREKCEALYEFFTSCALEDNVNSMAKKMEAIGEKDAAARQKQVYNLMINVLDAFCSALGSEIISLSDFSQILCDSFENVEIGIIPTTLDEVCAGSIDRVKGHGARAVYILGANSGVFPAVTTDGGVFCDADIRELSQVGLEMPPDSRERTFAEQLLIYDALTCATNRLHVSYALSSSDGGALRESPIVQALRAIFLNITFFDRSVTTDTQELVCGADATYEDFALGYGSDIDNTTWRQVLACYETDERFAQRLCALKNSHEYTNAASRIDGELLDKLYKDALTSSVTRLEAYRKCPFSYFAAYTLNLRERETAQLMPASAGSFLHDFVDMFCKSVEGDAISWNEVTDEYINKKSDAIAAAALGKVNQHILASSPRLRHIFSELLRISKRSVRAIRDHISKSAFEPLGYEITFSENGAFKPLTLTLPGGRRLRLTGKIDRADLLECPEGRFARIVDYKSGHKEFSLSNVYFGLDLQLCVYITALCENTAAKASGILYFKLDDPVVTSLPPDALDDEIESCLNKTLSMRGLVTEYESIAALTDGDFLQETHRTTPERFSLLTRRAAALVSALTAELCSGRTDIAPLNDACDYCVYHTLCSFDAAFRGCARTTLKALKDAEVWDRLEENLDADITE
ncbi:MAG: PD-(D/E)XK nuclease family protein [Clostridia bacterium]|nr:PD-(D/E)XK nuclease family protein [Clostridia bacterium]